MDGNGEYDTLTELQSSNQFQARSLFFCLAYTHATAGIFTPHEITHTSKYNVQDTYRGEGTVTRHNMMESSSDVKCNKLLENKDIPDTQCTFPSSLQSITHFWS
jgi:hypothetical protein